MPQRIGLHVLLEIGIIDQLGTTMLERSMPHGLTVSQFMVLDHLSRNGDDLTPRKLAEATQVTKATIASTLQRLMTKHLIVATVHPDDQRSKRICMTDHGYSVYVEASNAITQNLLALQMGVGLSELISVLPVLAKLKECLSARHLSHREVSQKDEGSHLSARAW